MIRDEIQIRAEKEFAVEQARAEALAKGREEGEVKGRIEGKAEGKADAQREIAAKLKATGADPKFISEITGMTVEDISML